MDFCREGDELVVWKLDRSVRSLIDTPSPGGKLVFHVFERYRAPLLFAGTRPGDYPLSGA